MALCLTRDRPKNPAWICKGKSLFAKKISPGVASTRKTRPPGNDESHCDCISSYCHSMTKHMGNWNEHEKENSLVVSTHLKNISQIGSFHQIGVKTKKMKSPARKLSNSKTYSFLVFQPQSATRKISCSRRKHRDEAVTTFGRETSQWMMALTSKLVWGCFADVDTPLKFKLHTAAYCIPNIS